MGPQELACCSVPEANGSVQTARKQALSVGRERYLDETSGVSLEDADQLTARSIPKLECLVPSSREQALPSGENAADQTIVSSSTVRSSSPLATSHSLSVLSSLAESRRVPSGENATERTPTVCPSKLRISWPLAVSQSLILSLVSSNMTFALPETRHVPSGEKATDSTPSECPSKVRMSWPLTASQSLRVLSWLPESRCVPSGENATELTLPVCPWKVRISWPLLTSHSLRVVSSLPETRRVPSGENVTELTPPVCPSKVRMSWPLAASQSLRVLSFQQTAMPVIGFLSIRSPGDSAYVMDGFHRGLKESGYVEGQNLTIEYRWLEGHYDRARAMAEDLVKRGVAVIAVAGGDVSVLASAAR
jgi:hypothetical protein